MSGVQARVVLSMCQAAKAGVRWLGWYAVSWLTSVGALQGHASALSPVHSSTKTRKTHVESGKPIGETRHVHSPKAPLRMQHTMGFIGRAMRLYLFQ
jgi:hypothetical protein